MMKKILVLGAGLVSRPLVRYVLDQNYLVTMASRTVSKAEHIINGHPNGTALPLNVQDDKQLKKLVSPANIVVSLLPYTYHVKVAQLCIDNAIPLVTTSYVSKEMQNLDEKAKAAGVLLLNECGLDPGIDHMSAMKVIHDVEENGGKITSFRSTTGALPSHEANNNPFGYKFSWSPRGVLLASRNAAQWLEHGKEITIPSEALFEHYTIEDVPGVGSFENYPNRNSIPYKEHYGLHDAYTVYRGTFRMTGWCETLRCLVALGWLQDTSLSGFTGKTYGDLTKALIDAGQHEDVIQATTQFLGLKPYAAIIKRLQWLGLFSDDPLPTDKNNPLDYLNVLTLKKMSLGNEERDMIVMHHEFYAQYANTQEYITSTLVDYGEPNKDSAIARTVSLPAAMAVKLILQNKITVAGVHIPVLPAIYNPILGELESMGIQFIEKRSPLPPTVPVKA